MDPTRASTLSLRRRNPRVGLVRARARGEGEGGRASKIRTPQNSPCPSSSCPSVPVPFIVSPSVSTSPPFVPLRERHVLEYQPVPRSCPYSTIPPPPLHPLRPAPYSYPAPARGPRRQKAHQTR